MNRPALRTRAATLLALFIAGGSVLPTNAQSKAYERTFSQPAASVRKALQQIQGGMAGHLPILDGFADAGEHPLDRYQRGYFQAAVQVSSTAAGESVVRISAKVTAWFDDPQKIHSGYEVLRSNGRIENDVLDQLSEQLAATSSKKSAPSSSKPTSEVAHSVPTKNSSEPPISAPQPRVFDSPSVLSPLSRGLATAESTSENGASQPGKPAVDPDRTRLQAELQQLQEVFKNQAHPKNMAAVKKSGTSVVSTPSLSAKPMFLAAAHDEFEILNYNQDWVHVRISGLSRGWIWRNDLEMPDTVPDNPSAPATSAAAEFFHIVREENAQFPGDWEPLRGKNVKLISVQKIDESAKDSGSQLKLEFAKSVFQKAFAELAQKSDDLAGIVLIFDSADGGMIAAPQSILAKWKAGALSDSGFWRSCYFDPPETFTGGGNSASQ